MGERVSRCDGLGGRPSSLTVLCVCDICICWTSWWMDGSARVSNRLFMRRTRESTCVVSAFILLCRLSDNKVFALFIVAILVCSVFNCVWMEACPSATLPMMLVVCSIRADMDSSIDFSDDVLVSFDEITMLCIRSNSVSTRVKSFVRWDVVEVVSDVDDCEGLGAVNFLDLVDAFDGKRGWSQSEPFGSFAFIPIVRGSLRCLAGGSRLGFATIETKLSVPSVGRFKLRM